MFPLYRIFQSSKIGIKESMQIDKLETVSMNPLADQGLQAFSKIKELSFSSIKFDKLKCKRAK